MIGFWKANAIDDDTILVENENSKFKLESIRQQVKKAAGQLNISLTDFIKPSVDGKSISPESDYIGAFAVSIHGIELAYQKFQENFDDHNKITLQALADRFRRSIC